MSNPFTADALAAELSMWGECGGGAFPVQHFGEFAGRDYYVRYRFGWLTVDEDNDEDVFEQHLGDEYGGYWTDEQTTLYLFLISRAIRQGTLRQLIVPNDAAASTHPAHVKGPHPIRLAGLDAQGGQIWVAPMDLEQWLSENAAEHERLLAGPSRAIWDSYVRLQGGTKCLKL